MLPSSSAAAYSTQPLTGPQPFNDVSNAGYSTGTHRVAFPSNFQSTDTHMPHQYQYVPQPTRPGMPYPMSQAPSANFSASSAFDPQWGAMSSNTRRLSSSSTIDANIPSSYQSPAYPYLPSSGASYATGTSEASTVFPGLSPLASNLPYSSSNRTLPNPTNGSSMLHSSNSPLHEEEGSLGFYSGHVDKNHGSWDIPSVTSRGSVSSAAQDPISASELASNTSSSSPTNTPDGSIIGFGHPSRLSQVGSDASISALNSGNVSRRMSGDDDYTATAPSLQSSHSGNGHFSNLDPTFNMQSMHGGFGLQEDNVTPMNPTSSTVSTQLPPSILHPQPQYNASLDVPSVLRGSPETSLQGQRSSHAKARGLRSHGMR